MRKPLAFWDACSKRGVLILRFGLSKLQTLLERARKSQKMGEKGRKRPISRQGGQRPLTWMTLYSSPWEPMSVKY